MLLERQKIPIWIRQVVVPGITDSRENLFRLADLLAGKKCVQKVEFLPFRKLCKEKYSQMGIPFPLDRVPEATDRFFAGNMPVIFMNCCPQDKKADEKSRRPKNGRRLFTKCIGDESILANSGKKYCRNIANHKKFLCLFYFSQKVRTEKMTVEIKNAGQCQFKYDKNNIAG